MAFETATAQCIVFVTLPSMAFETATAQCTSRCAMARGHRLKFLTRFPLKLAENDDAASRPFV